MIKKLYSLELTAEQRAALVYAISSITDDRPDDPMTYPQLLGLLRQLLSQSRPAWEITEERIVTMNDAMTLFGCAKNLGPVCREKSEWVMSNCEILRDMLAEAEGKI